MHRRLLRFLSPPSYEGDEEKTRFADILNAILWFFIGIWLVLLPVVIVISNDRLKGVMFILCLSAGTLASLILLHTRHPTTAAWLFCISSWAIISLLLVFFDGIYNPIIGGFIQVVLVAGLLLGLRGSFLLAGFSILSVISMYSAQRFGVLPTPVFTLDPNVALIISIANVTITLGVLRLLLSHLYDAIKKVETNKTEILTKNEALNHLLESLEAQVAERTQSAEAALKEAKDARRDVEEQMWFTIGQVQISDRMRGDQDIHLLATNVMTYLCNYINAQVGVLYLWHGDTLDLAGGYAIPNNESFNQSFKPGEGLIGQVVQDRRMIQLDIQSPEDGSLFISSATGEIVPKKILIWPFTDSGDLVGIIEVGALNDFLPNHIEFLGRVSASIAIAFRTNQARKRIEELRAGKEI